MGRYRKIGILLAVLAVVTAAAFGVSRYEEEKERIENSDEVILEIDPETVSALSWEYESETLGFHKDETWLYDGDEAFPVDEEKIAELLGLFREFGVSFVIEEVEDYGQYGLDNPVCKINFVAGEESYEVSLGNFSTMDSQRYVSIGDGKVYLVSKDPLDYFDAKLSDMIKHDKPLSYNSVSAIRFDGIHKESIVYEEDSKATYCAEDVYFLENDAERLPLDTTRVNGYLQSLSYLNLVNYVTYNATQEELAEYGLNEPELTVEVDYSRNDAEDADGGTVEDTFVLHISRSAEEKENNSVSGNVKEEDTGEDFNAYIRIGDSPIIYEVGSAEYNDIMKASYNDLRHLEVLPASFADINQIDITLEGVDYFITSSDEEEDGEEKRSYYYLEKKLDITDLRTAVRGLSASEFTEESPSEKEEIRMTVHLDNENYPTVEIVLYRYDGTSCIAVVDGSPVCLVSRAAVVDLIEAVNAVVLG